MPKTFNILHAGALRKPVRELMHILMERYPQLKVSIEYAGSRSCAKAVVEGRKVDVLILADHKLFHDMLIPRHVDKYYIFATDQIVLGYDEFSAGGQLVSNENWPDILLKQGVKYARSDHQLDPCGYRTLMLWQLAEKYYQRANLYRQLEDNWSNLYPKSIDVAVALMEGKIDYGFIYLSVAKQMGLQYISLPAEINLSDPRLAEYYAGAQVDVEGDHRGLKVQIHGSPIEFAVAIPHHTFHKEIAEEFISLLTSSVGEEILECNGLIPC